jgi:nucleotide-binding universal stress UspA family protein
MIRKILVPVDGSGFAECALPMALSLAEKTGGEVRLAMVNEPSHLPPGVWAEAFLANHSKYMDAVTDEVMERAGPHTTVSSVLLEGEVAHALGGEVEASGADLVVMSTHGHGGLARVWLGSVADALLRDCPIPVLLVRPGEDEKGDPTGAEGASRIVVPLDGSAFAEAAIGPALEMGRLFAADVMLLRAVSYPVMVSSYLPDTIEENEAFIRHAEGEAEAYLEDVSSRFEDRHIAFGKAVLVSPQPASAILKHVADTKADFVVMASHNRHGVARVVLGSVADKVVRGSHTPVLIVHQPD